MFTRSRFGTADIGRQGRILDEMSDLVEAGRLRTTLTDTLGPLTVENLRRAHAQIETNSARGKLVLDGM